MKYVIGCDIGSQAVKVILLTAEGAILGEAGCAYPIEYPRPAWAQQNASLWIPAITASIRELLATCGVDGNQVSAIGLDAHVDGVVAVDAAGEPLHPALIWMDRRAVPQVEQVAATHDARRLFDLSGLNLDAYHVAPKIRWLLENCSQVAENVRYFMLPGSYVAYHLTGEVAIDYSNASSTILLDIRSRQWSAELCAAFNIPQETLPPVFPADRVLGTLRQEVASATGLLPSTRVILGCGDEHAASLGAGVVRPGLVCDIAGTAEPVCAASPEPLFDQSGLVETHCHAHPHLWLLENPGFVSGANYRWFRDQFCPLEMRAAEEQGLDAYDLLNELAAKAPPGSDGLILLPALMGAMTPTWNAHARGTYLGFTLAHRREHFIRAVMEASAFAMRDITDRMQGMGLPLREIRVVGGGARSALWRQIKADVSGLPVAMLNTVETTALGAAILALVGAGIFTSLDQAVQAVVQVVETRQPDPAARAHYEDYYQTYREAYFALLPVFEKAAQRGL